MDAILINAIRDTNEKRLFPPYAGGGDSLLSCPSFTALHAVIKFTYFYTIRQVINSNFVKIRYIDIFG